METVRVFDRAITVGLIQMKLSLYFAVGLALLLNAACGHKPSYSQIDTDQAGKASNQNAAASSVATKPSQLPDSQPPETSPQAAPTQAAGVAPPSFFDSRTGQIKDLPSYPGSRRVRIGFGPVSGFESMGLLLSSRDPFDKVVAFYEQAIKSNGWTVVENSRADNTCQWTLSKEAGQGVVQVTTQPQGRPVVYVTLQRAKAIEQTK